jgi:hypothetical protein
MMTHKLAMMMGALMLAGVAGTAARADASERVSVGLSFGRPSYYAPTTVVERSYVPGHYEVRSETVLVEPERKVREWSAPQTTSRTDARGYVYTVTSPGSYRDTCVPARYETRQTQVWVPGYYSDVAIERPVVHSRPRVSFGGFFRF